MTKTERTYVLILLEIIKVYEEQGIFENKYFINKLNKKKAQFEAKIIKEEN
jgi:hypothetical protein